MDSKVQSRPAIAGSSHPVSTGGAAGFVPGEPGCPPRLGELAAKLPQVALLKKPLWLRGEAAALSARPAVTIVGSRAASASGEALAYTLAAALSAAGGLVISGGALGIDAAAHRGALSVDGRTCAVLGCGVDIAYPQRHAGLFKEIVQRGCLLSSFAPGSQPQSWHFPARNELMALLADLVVIIEARADSGSLITAKQARRHGRPLAAFPGSPGADAALQAGAYPVHSVADVLALLASLPSAVAPQLPLPGARSALRVGAPAPSFLNESSAELAEMSEGSAEAEESVLAALSRSATDLGELCARTGLSPGDCAAALVDLELRGRCTRLAGGRYIVHAPLS